MQVGGGLLAAAISAADDLLGTKSAAYLHPSPQPPPLPQPAQQAQHAGAARPAQPAPSSGPPCGLTLSDTELHPEASRPDPDARHGLSLIHI